MEVLPLISTPVSTPWAAWLVFAMLLLLMLNEWLQPQFVVESFRSSFTSSDRIFGDHSSTFSSMICSTAYQILVFSFVLYLCISPIDTFDGVCLAQMALLFVGYLFVRVIGYGIADFAFDLSRTFAPNRHQFAALRQSLALVLFPISLMMINLTNLAWLPWVIMGLVGCYLLMLVIKTIRTFWDGIVSLPYILLYLLTLEILPLGLVIMGAHYIC